MRLGAEVRQDSAKMASRTPKSEKPRELPSGLSLPGRLLGALGGVLGPLGGLWRRLGGALEAEARQDSAKMAPSTPKSENPRELPSGLRPPGQWAWVPTCGVARRRRSGRAWS